MLHLDTKKLVDNDMDELINVLNASNMSQDETDVVRGCFDNTIKFSEQRIKVFFSGSDHELFTNTFNYQQIIKSDEQDLIDVLNQSDMSQEETDVVYGLYSNILGTYRNEFEVLKSIRNQTNRYSVN